MRCISTYYQHISCLFHVGKSACYLRLKRLPSEFHTDHPIGAIGESCRAAPFPYIMVYIPCIPSIYTYGIYTISTNSDVDKELGILGFQNLVFPPFPSMVYHNTPLKGLPFVFAIHNWTSGI